MTTCDCRNRALPLSDRAGIGAAVLCAIHCVATPWLVSMMPLLGLFVADRRTEMTLLCASIAISARALTSQRAEGCDMCWRSVLAFLIGVATLIVLRAGFAEGVDEMATVVIGASLIVYAHTTNAVHRRQNAREPAALSPRQ